MIKLPGLIARRTPSNPIGADTAVTSSAPATPKETPVTVESEEDSPQGTVPAPDPMDYQTGTGIDFAARREAKREVARALSAQFQAAEVSRAQHRYAPEGVITHISVPHPQSGALLESDALLWYDNDHPCIALKNKQGRNVVLSMTEEHDGTYHNFSVLAEGEEVPAGYESAFEKLNNPDSLAESPPTPTIDGPAPSDFDPVEAIKIAADDIYELRRVDVFRVLDTYETHRVELARYIAEQRPDLKQEVAEVLAELADDTPTVEATNGADTNPETFFDTDGTLREWNNAEVMPEDWKGVALRDSTYFYVGHEGGERSYTALSATEYAVAIEEAAVVGALAVDINEVLADPEVQFSHYEAFEGESLESAMRGCALTTIGNVTGHDPARFYDQAHYRLSSVFGIAPDETQVSNAYLERKGLAQAFALKAEDLSPTPAPARAPVNQTVIETDNSAPEEMKTPQPSRSVALLEPWQMTKSEWENAYSCAKQEHAIEKILQLTNNVYQPAQDLIEAAITDRIKLDRHVLEDAHWRIHTAVTHYDVVHKAASDGHNVPPEAMSEYPEIQDGSYQGAMPLLGTPNARARYVTGTNIFELSTPEGAKAHGFLNLDKDVSDDPDKQIGQILHVYVPESSRRQGLALSLIKDCAKVIEAHGLKVQYGTPVTTAGMNLLAKAENATKPAESPKPENATSAATDQVSAAQPVTANTRINFSAIVRDSDGLPYHVNTKRHGKMDISAFVDGRPRVSADTYIIVDLINGPSDFYFDGEYWENDQIVRLTTANDKTPRDDKTDSPSSMEGEEKKKADAAPADSDTAGESQVTPLTVHELTLAQFASLATAEALTNHGRRWAVRLGDYSAFSDAATAEEAVADVHHGAVNNALYLNTPEARSANLPGSSLPPAEVLAEYPDLVERFPAAGQRHEATSIANSHERVIEDKAPPEPRQPGDGYYYLSTGRKGGYFTLRHTYYERPVIGLITNSMRDQYIANLGPNRDLAIKQALTLIPAESPLYGLQKEVAGKGEEGGPEIIKFGQRYRGMDMRVVAEQDPQYLWWLYNHGTLARQSKPFQELVKELAENSSYVQKQLKAQDALQWAEDQQRSADLKRRAHLRELSSWLSDVLVKQDHQFASDMAQKLDNGESLAHDFSPGMIQGMRKSYAKFKSNRARVNSKLYKRYAEEFDENLSISINQTKSFDDAPPENISSLSKETPIIERYEWLNKDGGETAKLLMEIRPLDDDLFNRYIKDEVHIEWNTLTKYQQQVPLATHISLGSKDGGETWFTSVLNIGSLDDLRPQGEANQVGWAKRLDEPAEAEVKMPAVPLGAVVEPTQEEIDALLDAGDLEGASRLFQTQKAIRQQNLLDSYGNVIAGMEVKHNKDERWAAILPEMSSEGKGRIQYFDEHGFSGHSVYPSLDRALEELVNEGYIRPDKGALDRLQGTDEWARGIETADRIQKMNAPDWKPAPAEPVTKELYGGRDLFDAAQPATETDAEDAATEIDNTEIFPKSAKFAEWALERARQTEEVTEYNGQEYRVISRMFRGNIGAKGAKLKAELPTSNRVTLISNESQLRTIEVDGQYYGDRGRVVVSDIRYVQIVNKDESKSGPNQKQTDTPAFQSWFGDSKVLDGMGKPLVVYHGTELDFAEFDLSQSDGSEKGFFFTSSKRKASRYGDNVIAVYLSLQNPYITTQKAWSQGTDAGIEAARKAGHDGYIVEGLEGRATYIAFSATQIKSSTGNNGEFDPKNPNIYDSQRHEELSERENSAIEPASETTRENESTSDTIPELTTREQIDTFPRFSVYKTGSRYAIRGDGRYGMGDTLESTPEQAITRAAFEKQQYETRMKSLADEEARSSAQLEAENLQIESYSGFLSDVPMHQERQRNTLEANVRSEGKVTTRKQLIEDRIKAGYRINEVEVIDQSAKSKVQKEIERLSLRAPTGNENHPDTMRLRKLQGRIESNDFKTIERRLENEEGGFLLEKDITKVGMDYAAHLVSAQPVEGKSAGTPSTVKTEKLEEIADFGEKIGGAKKDLWKTRGLTIADLASLTERERVSLVKKQQVFPKPDYQALTDHYNRRMDHLFQKVKDKQSCEIADQVDLGASMAYLVKTLYDSIQNPRAEWSEEGYQQYIRGVERVKVFIENSQTLNDLKDNTLQTIFGEGIITGTGYRRKIDSEHEFYGPLCHLGSKFIKTAQFSDRDVTKAMKKVLDTGFPAKQQAWQRRYRVIPGKRFKITEACRYTDDGRIPVYALEVYNLRICEYRDDKSSIERLLAESKEKYFVGHKKYRLKLDEATPYPTEEEAVSAAKALYDKGVRKSARQRPIHKSLKIERIGKDHRKGLDVTTDLFLETFGWRGGEFGTWANQQERQNSLNMAYDALMDLSEVLGLQPRALSLNGELGIAFGARGSGHAAAHYECSRVVINLTKTMGAGSLAHEWAHAIDDYFGRLSSARPFTNDRYSPFYSRGPFRKDAIREEMRAAWNAVTDVMLKKTETIIDTFDPEATAKSIENYSRAIADDLDSIRSRILQDNSRYSKRYKVPTAKQIEQIDSIIDKLKSGDIGEIKLRPRSQVKTTTTRLNELLSISKAIQGRENYSAHLSNMLSMRAYLQGKLSDPPPPKEIARLMNTRYASAAGALDGSKKEPYWSAKPEMFARAFESYVLDKIMDDEGLSDYLVHQYKRPNENGITLYRGPDEKPYPWGEERQAINDAMSHLFSTMRQEETEKGIALFMRSLNSEGKRVRPLAANDIDLHVQRLLAHLNVDPGLTLKVVASIEDLPRPAYEQLLLEGNVDEVHATYYEGVLYLVAEQIDSIRTIEEAILHETWGHYGERRLFGSTVWGAYQNLYRELNGDEGIAAYAKRHGLNMEPYFRASNNLPPEQREFLLITELVANHQGRIAGELGHKKLARLIRELIGAIKDWLRNSGYAILSRTTDSDLAYLMQRMRVAATGQETKIPVIFNVNATTEYTREWPTDDLQVSQRNPHTYTNDPRNRIATDGVSDRTATQQNQDNFAVLYKHVKTGEVRTGLTQVQSAADVAHVVAPIRKFAHEHLFALVVNNKGDILELIRHTSGTATGSKIDPSLLVASIASNGDAAAVWLAHNHPTVDAKPSNDDIALTRQVSRALEGSGIDLSGHVIVAPGGRYTSHTSLDIKVQVAKIPPIRRTESMPFNERTLRRFTFEQQTKITSSMDAKRLVNGLRTTSGLVLLNHQRQTVGVLALDNQKMAELKGQGGVNRILQAIDATNAAGCIVFTDCPLIGRNVGNYLSRLSSFKHLDTIIRDKGKLISAVDDNRALNAMGPFSMRKTQETRKRPSM